MERLLERDDELGMLAGLVDQAAVGRGSLALVAGEAGIGKTSLMRALRGQADARVAFLTGACEPLSVPVPLGPLRELFEAAGGASLTELGSDDRLVLARALLDRLSERAPVAAVIEDLHWADPMTLDLVRLLARRVEQSGVAIVATYRDDEVGANPALGLLLGDLATRSDIRRIVLRPLSQSAVRELAGPKGLDVGRLVRATGGNPFLVVETLAAGSGLPASVRDAALARAGRLSPAARAAVDAAAVIGQRFSPELLESVAPGGAEAVDEALARGVLVAEGPRLGFRHELIRDAIESAIPPPRRAELHRRVAAQLAGQPGSDQHARLAHHAELGDMAAEACRYATLAADEAERVGALREVRLQTERALRLGAELVPGERFELLVRLARASNFSADSVDDAAAPAREALAIADRLGDPARRGRALVTLAWALWSMDQVADAKAAAEQAVAALERGDDAAALARAYSTQVRMEATAFDPARAIELESRALELSERAGLDDVRLEIAISVALARGHSGERAALDTLSGALRDARASGLSIQAVRAYVNLMVLGVALRAHALVDRTLPEALALFEELHTSIPARAIESYLARSLLDRARFDEALTTAERGRSAWHAEVPGVRAVEGLVRARRGERGATALLERAWAEITPVAEGSRHAMIRSALVEDAWLRGDLEAARELARAALGSPVTARFARPASDLAIWGRRLGIDAEPHPNAPEPVRLEMAGDWRAAIAAWRELDAPYEAALAALPGDDAAAREALGALRALGAEAAARAFVRERTAAGARAPRGPRSSTLANAAGLTRREQEVLDVLATGATNAAIAASLHLSERTVAHHVSAILRKLDAPTRLAAVERARSRALLTQDGQVSGPR